MSEEFRRDLFGFTSEIVRLLRFVPLLTHHSSLRQPFTAPAATPLMMCFWQAR